MMFMYVVKPDSVSELQVVESLANSATLRWKSPAPDEIILFRVSAKSLADNSKTVVSLAFIALYVTYFCHVYFDYDAFNFCISCH